MLRKPGSKYWPGRTSDLLKLKPSPEEFDTSPESRIAVSMIGPHH
jgi:hypothetical protein